MAADHEEFQEMMMSDYYEKLLTATISLVLSDYDDDFKEEFMGAIVEEWDNDNNPSKERMDEKLRKVVMKGYRAAKEDVQDLNEFITNYSNQLASDLESDDDEG